MNEYKETQSCLFGQYFEIVCGTTEEFLIGFQVSYRDDNSFCLKSTFANHSHCSGINKLAICGTTLVSGGKDEMIHVFNMKRRGKVGVIGEHEATITDIQQHKQKYIISAGEDAKICIFKTGVWECEKTLTGHKGAINSISIHPTGKIALSVGMDKTLHTWDLIKGRKAFVYNLNEIASLVRWSPSGDRYVVVSESCFDVYEVETVKKIYSVDLYARINEIVFVDEQMVAVALENGKVCLHNIEENLTLQQWEAHTNRVKSMALMPTAEESDMLYIVTGSTDGWVKVWSVSKLNYRLTAECVTSKNTQCRVTCLAVYSDADYKESLVSRHHDLAASKSITPATPNLKKKKRKEEYDEKEELEEEEEEEEYKPVMKKKKSVQILDVPVEEEKEEELIEEFKGSDAMDMLGLSSSSGNQRSKRKNRGKPAKRLAEEDSD